jgi:hypothetical protein
MTAKLSTNVGLFAIFRHHTRHRLDKKCKINVNGSYKAVRIHLLARSNAWWTERILRRVLVAVWWTARNGRACNLLDRLRQKALQRIIGMDGWAKCVEDGVDPFLLDQQACAVGSSSPFPAFGRICMTRRVNVIDKYRTRDGMDYIVAFESRYGLVVVVHEGRCGPVAKVSCCPFSAHTTWPSDRGGGGLCQFH